MSRNRNGLYMIAGVVLGGFAGALAARALDRPSSVTEPGVASMDPDARVGDRPGTPPPDLDPVRLPADSVPVAERAAPQKLPLFSPALIDHATAGLAEGWRSERSDAMPDDVLEAALERFREAVLAMPAALGRELARERTAREEALADARTGGVFALLERLDAGGAGPVLELARDDAALEQLFRRDSMERVVDGASSLASREAVADGTTLARPAGVFRLVDFTRNWSSSQPFPRDVTITGAGMNATLFVLDSDVSSRTKLRNLRFRDCTLYTADNYAFRTRAGGTRARRRGFSGGTPWHQSGQTSMTSSSTAPLSTTISISAGRP